MIASDVTMLRIREGLRLSSGTDRYSCRHKELLEDLSKVEEELRQARQCMDQTTDPDLIDSAIFAVKAAESRHTALVKMLREFSEQGLSEWS